MKSYILTLSIAFTAFFGMSADDQLGKSGDNLDLNAVLELFKESESIEEFEQELNSEKNGINNLDLNEDGFVDYIRVIDYSNGDVHAITLQVPYSDSEAQDVAVIEIEKTGDDQAIVQIVGDEELYGSNYIVEPQDVNRDANVAVNVFAWKPVRHVYSPRYTIWVSPWRYRSHPVWFKPWRPVVWANYHNRHVHHHTHYRRVNSYRCRAAHGHYYQHKSFSPTYKTNHVHAHPNTNKAAITKQKSSSPAQKKQVQPSQKVQHSNKPAQNKPAQKAKSSVKPTQKSTGPTKGKGRTNSASKSKQQSSKSNRSSKSGRKH